MIGGCRRRGELEEGVEERGVSEEILCVWLIFEVAIVKLYVDSMRSRMIAQSTYPMFLHSLNDMHTISLTVKQQSYVPPENTAMSCLDPVNASQVA
jgi:hypothetical protein